MEDVVSLIFAAENVRTLVILVVCICGVVWLNTRMDRRFLEQEMKFGEMDKRFLEQEMKFKDALSEMGRSIEYKQKEALADFHLKLKSNDFKHLEDGIDALVYVLGEKGSITPEGKAYVQEVMDRGREAPGGEDPG